MSSYGDGDYPAVSTIEHRKARKPHKCGACHEAITPGRKYTLCKNLWEGSWYTWLRCERCQAIYEHLSGRMRVEDDRDEYCDAELNCGDTYEERWDESPPEAIAALAFWRPGDPLPKAKA